MPKRICPSCGRDAERWHKGCICGTDFRKTRPIKPKAGPGSETPTLGARLWRPPVVGCAAFLFFAGLALIAKGHAAPTRVYAVCLLVYIGGMYAGALIAKAHEGADELIWFLFRPCRLMWRDWLDPWFFWLLLPLLLAVPCLFWLGANLPPGAKLWPW